VWVPPSPFCSTIGGRCTSTIFFLLEVDLEKNRRGDLKKIRRHLLPMTAYIAGMCDADNYLGINGGEVLKASLAARRILITQKDRLRPFGVGQRTRKSAKTARVTVCVCAVPSDAMHFYRQTHLMVISVPSSPAAGDYRFPCKGG
jgi:hypothetical protein